MFKLLATSSFNVHYTHNIISFLKNNLKSLETNSIYGNFAGLTRWAVLDFLSFAAFLILKLDIYFDITTYS